MFWFAPFIGIASALFVGGVVAAIVINHVITHRDIKRSIKELEVDDAFKYKILKAKEHAVNVGIFDVYDNYLGETELTSDYGMSNSVKYSGDKEYMLYA